MSTNPYFITAKQLVNDQWVESLIALSPAQLSSGIAGIPTSTDALPEGSSNLYYTIARQVAGSVQARTSTSDGLTTGIIADTATHVTVTSSSGNNIITLPTPTPGRMVVIDVGANGFKLVSTAPATVAINGGVGSGVKSTIAASSTLVMICISATAWKGFFLDADSDVAKVPAAA